MARLIVDPKVAQFDHKLTIQIEGLQARQRVTIRNELENETGGRFESFAEYEANASGTVDLSTMPAISGTYTGIEPMGLFWSLDPVAGQKYGIRLLKQNASLPVETQLSVLDSCGNIIAQESVQRTFLAPEFSKITIDEDGIKGHLFVPPGEGPFPAVLDLYGTVGGLVEHRASLLASKGFVVLALAYFGYDGLPADMYFEINYFEKSIEWLLQYPKVHGNSGVGIVGLSKGAELGLYLSTISPQVKAVVSIGGFPFFVTGEHFRNGKALQNIDGDYFQVELSEKGFLNCRHCFENVDYTSHIFQFENADARYLVVTGEEDSGAASEAQKAGVDRLKELGKDVVHLVYPSVGHIIEPPFTPFCEATYFGTVGMMMAWGGEKKAQMKAQDDMWPKVIDFLHQSLQIKRHNHSQL